jgi:hypothetical protein
MSGGRGETTGASSRRPARADAAARGSVRRELALARRDRDGAAAVLALVETVTHQRRSSRRSPRARPDHLDPATRMTSVRTLTVAQGVAALVAGRCRAGARAATAAAGGRWCATIALKIALDVCASPSHTDDELRAPRGEASNLALSRIALAITAALVVLQRAAV